ncbi:hypothetical protein C3432_07855 [Citrobacter amalonaticus]|uniref:DNA-binding response regulator n=2 Tax=Citrobacter amalonaticus TaxID=35703 RepID=A0A2S4RY93_CITAM|nr:hypothetical protein C3432_07855 [Citrobacter amalonaticus]POT76625.1 hypothetical protein C3436_03970 [Citrobacter amalonaticus]POU65704.1 hypothetical protein C3430_10385 [Citrobacter amalonaticus]POV05861.1 hypothetical protein C3424_11270 [Citrobacter amalonaticus]
MQKRRRLTGALIYSPNWTHRVALEYLVYDKREQTTQIIKSSDTLTTILQENESYTPILCVLDMLPRNSVSAILSLRKMYPEIAIVFVGNYFLYSDRMVAEYFGGIYLKEYDAILAGYPDISMNEHIISTLFSGAYPPIRNINKDISVESVLASLECWIKDRLTGVMPSPRVREIVLKWLVKGASPAEVARILGRSDKVMYHYRWLMIRALGIRKGGREFIASLSVAAGPTGPGGSVEQSK